MSPHPTDRSTSFHLDSSIANRNRNQPLYKTIIYQTDDSDAQSFIEFLTVLPPSECDAKRRGQSPRQMASHSELITPLQPNRDGVLHWQGPVDPFVRISI